MRLSLIALLVVAGLGRAAEPFPPVTPAVLGDATKFGANVQRTMRLLATSTAEKRNPVRVLFYGQSITEQKWADIVTADLKARFPHADLTVENRALAGYSSQLLVKTAETDLYPFAPDLVIFHVYGAHDKYEDIVRRTRERTGAEVLMQTDHVVRPADFTEETDAAKLPPAGKHWDAFMNQNWLPSLAKKYDCELCDQRAIWKRYLTANKLAPKALLSDDVHLNAHGEFLMAECVKAYLRYDPAAKPAADGYFTTIPVVPTGGPIVVPFTGSRVELLFQPGATKPVAVQIDGVKPSDIPGAYVFTRALAKPGGKWPVVAGMRPSGKPVAEGWTLELTKDAAKPKHFAFTLKGSVTGPDGEGRTDAKFVSKSGRVTIVPEDWGVDYALALRGIKPVPDRLTVTFKSVLQGRDVLRATGLAAGGLANGPHELTLTGDLEGVAGVRVTRPPLGRAK
jgi:hypothetical protein